MPDHAWNGWRAEAWSVDGRFYATVYTPRGDGVHIDLAEVEERPLFVLSEINALRRRGDPSAVEILVRVLPEAADLLLRSVLIG